MAMTAEPQAMTLDTLRKEINEAVARAGDLTGRVARIGDHLGGGIPRGVDSGAEATDKPAPGVVFELLAGMRELRARHDLLRDELGRVDSLCGRSSESASTVSRRTG